MFKFLYFTWISINIITNFLELFLFIKYQFKYFLSLTISAFYAIVKASNQTS